jgi:hypothetical protein
MKIEATGSSETLVPFYHTTSYLITFYSSFKFGFSHGVYYFLLYNFSTIDCELKYLAIKLIICHVQYLPFRNWHTDRVVMFQ